MFPHVITIGYGLGSAEKLFKIIRQSIMGHVCSCSRKFCFIFLWLKIPVMCLSIGTPKTNKFSICPKVFLVVPKFRQILA